MSALGAVRRTIADYDAEFGAGSAVRELAAWAEAIVILAFQAVGWLLLAETLAGAVR